MKKILHKLKERLLKTETEAELLTVLCEELSKISEVDGASLLFKESGRFKHMIHCCGGEDLSRITLLKSVDVMDTGKPYCCAFGEKEICLFPLTVGKEEKLGCIGVILKRRDEEVKKYLNELIFEISLLLKDILLEKNLKILRKIAVKALDKVDEAVWVTDNNGRIIALNKRAEEIFNISREEALNKYCYRLIHGVDRFPDFCLMERLRKKGSDFEEMMIPVGDRTILVKLYPADKNMFIHISKDITSYIRQQAKLIQVERLAILANTFKNLVHELNNPLTAVQGFSQVIAERKDLPLEVIQAAKYIEKEAKRCAEIVRNITVFSQREDEYREVININEIIHSVVKPRKFLHKIKGIKVELKLAESLPPVVGNSELLKQAFLNLLTNAEDALEAAEEKRIFIKTYLTGKRICIEVGDTGVGIPKGVKDRIFDPFFTTKPIEKGTGLGLSLVYYIIVSHGGTVEFESMEGKGTLFRVFIPAFTSVDVLGKDRKHMDLVGNFVLLIGTQEFCNLLKKIMENHGAMVDMVYSTTEAVLRVDKFLYSAVFIDSKLPFVDIVEFVTHVVQSKPLYNKRLILCSEKQLSGDLEGLAQEMSLKVIESPFTEEKIVKSVVR